MEVKNDAIPARVRKVIYWVYFTVALGLGGVQAYVAATGGLQPPWLTGGLAVMAFAGSALGLQAAVYTPGRSVQAAPPSAESSLYMSEDYARNP